MKRPSSPRAAVQQLARALAEGDAEAASAAIHFPYSHLVDFRGNTSVHTYDAVRFQEALRERAAGRTPHKAAAEATVEPLSQTSAIVREVAGGTLLAAHTVVKQGTSWRVVVSWYADASPA